MINPANIQIDELPSVALEDKKHLPEVSCTYFAIDTQGVIQYIGQTKNLNRRWMSHHKRTHLSGGGIKIAYLDCPTELLEEIERALIDWFKPPLNTQNTWWQQSKPLRVFLDITPFWPNGLSTVDAAKELGMNPRSITTIRKGTERGSWDTLVKLSRWLSWRGEKEVSINDLLRIEGEDYQPGGSDE